MPIENDDNPASKLKDFIFILALAGSIDAQAKATAKVVMTNLAALAGTIDAQAKATARDLHKSRSIYYCYSVLDSLNSSYSMFKYFFDVFFAGNSDDMHDLMNTPAGIIGITLETLFLVSFSFLAAYYDGEKTESYKKSIATAWPYFRDVLKGLKNAFKGWRNLTTAMSLLGLIDLTYLIAPIGLGLGILAATNRYFMRSIVESRKAMMDNNADLYLDLKALNFLTKKQHDYFLRKEIKSQSIPSRRLAFMLAATGGLIDGLYLYVGVFALAALSPPLVITLAIFCAFYTLASIVTRVYEEYEYQLRLQITETKCRLILITKELTTSYALLLELQAKTNKDDLDEDQIAHLKSEIVDLVEKFAMERQLFRQQTSKTYFSASLLGLKNGLYAYGALSSIIFLVSTILLLAAVAFPPSLVLITVVTGLIFIVGFLAYSLALNHHQRTNQNNVSDGSFEQLIKLKDNISSGQQDTLLLNMVEFNLAVKDGLSVATTPQSYSQEWFEVIRSLFSGFGKGQKFVEFAGNPLQEHGGDGHYHDTPVMFVLGAASALLFGLVLALRALAKGIGRAPLGQDDLAADVVKQEPTKPVSVSPLKIDISKMQKAFDKEASSAEEDKITPALTKKHAPSMSPLPSLSLFKYKKSEPFSPSNKEISQTPKDYPELAVTDQPSITVDLN